MRSSPAAAVLFAAWILPGFDVPDLTDALLLVVAVASPERDRAAPGGGVCGYR